MNVIGDTVKIDLLLKEERREKKFYGYGIIIRKREGFYYDFYVNLYCHIEKKGLLNLPLKKDEIKAFKILLLEKKGCHF